MKISLLFILLLYCSISTGQLSYEDSLKNRIAHTAADSNRVNLLAELGDDYQNANPDSMFAFANRGLILARSIGYLPGEMRCLAVLANYSWSTGDFATAIKLHLQNLDYYTAQNDTKNGLLAYSALINDYRDQGDYPEALRYGFLTLKKTIRDYPPAVGIVTAMIGSIYYHINNYDSSNAFLDQALEHDLLHNDGWVLLTKGQVEAKLKNYKKALDFYSQSFRFLQTINNQKDLSNYYNSLGELYGEMGNTDSSLYYGMKGLRISEEKNFNKEKLQSLLLLAKGYEKTDIKKAYLYLQKAMGTKDSLNNQEKQRQILSFKFNEELRRQDLLSMEQRSKSNTRLALLLAILVCFVPFIIYLVYNNRRKQRTNNLLNQQKQQIAKAMKNLEDTQAQLVQREKMASLGELTAGIAHEIQNPLNFVNNFSELSTELIAEMNTELKAGNTEEAKMLSNDLKTNLEKILSHGRRADAIVKGMLQHSRTSKGVKEFTNLNSLADEYLRLSHHGFQLREKTMDIKLIKDYDPAIGDLYIFKEDIGRVLLNLYNNAFYSVTEKYKQLRDGYVPTVTITTKKFSDKIEITVKDNGQGIPAAIREKIFQPFFTTRPPGQGTGLGLSISYDIIKAQGGELMVVSEEGDGAEFIFQIITD